MAQYTIEEIYAGDKYHVKSDVMQEFFHKGRPVDYDTKTWLDMLIVKHSISVAEKMLKEGDSVSGIIRCAVSFLFVFPVKLSTSNLHSGNLNALSVGFCFIHIQ